MNDNSSLRFDNKIVIVTGAGNGLGRSHALQFAELGAHVVVNDLGGTAQGEGENRSAADVVVEEIQAKGGSAIADYHSVCDGERIVEHAMDQYGGIDVVVNNAGFLRDRSFHKMDQEDWQNIIDVHLNGAFKTTRAAWPHLRAQNFGRVLFTTSAAAIYGNFGQANYGAAKLGTYGLTRSLAIEGRSKNILVNAIAPVAASRLTEALMTEELNQHFDPALVSPLACFLCHESCQETGGLFEAGAGWYAKVRWQRSQGLGLAKGQQPSIDDIAKQWQGIVDFESPEYPEDSTAAITAALANLNN